MERYSGKVAIVTGASAGIGAAIAKKLVAVGMQVVGLARRVERIEELAKKLKGPGKLHGIKTDLTKEEDILEAFKWIKTNLGPIHILINNAGLMRNGDMMSLTTEDLKTTFDTNVIAMLITSQAAVRDMIENKVQGHIVTVNSVVGHLVPTNALGNVYPATKHAIKIIAEGLRMNMLALDSKIKISNVSPGIVESEFHDNYSGLLKEMVKQFPALKSEAVADAVLYILGSPPDVHITEMIIKPTGEPI